MPSRGSNRVGIVAGMVSKSADTGPSVTGNEVLFDRFNCDHGAHALEGRPLLPRSAAFHPTTANRADHVTQHQQSLTGYYNHCTRE
jgi:hypothetical protein